MSTTEFKSVLDQYVERGILKGKTEGIAEGKVEGKAEGKAERDIEIALNMKRKGYSTKDIADLTGLSPAEIERLG